MRWRAGPGDRAILRLRMVERLRSMGIDDERVLDAMGALPRHLFVDEALAARAYGEESLPIGSGQTISRPHTVALMARLLAPEPDHRVLEVGTGSGYQAAVLSFLAARVESVERLEPLARRARRIFRSLRIDNVSVHLGDGTVGLPERGPYPRIIVTAGSPGLPEALFAQLAEGGRMVVPVADERGGERLQVVERTRGRKVLRESASCAFVPLIGAEGYGEREPWVDE